MDFKIDIPNDVKEVMSVLVKGGFEAYVVGGCVRDSIIGKEPNDWDITTNALPTDVQNLFDEVIPTGIKHGTVTVMLNDEGYEVTTYRIDGDYDDGRSPNSVEFTDDIIKDLSRRDFTINAMAYNDEVGLVDPYNGMKDIESKRIKCVGNPNDRFKEDALRMMRAVRFSAQLGFWMSISTTISIERNREGISNVSYERIQSELNKILLSDSSKIKELFNTRLLHCIIPELSDLKSVYQNNNYHIYDVFEHSVCATNCIEDKLHLKLSALFHDLGKIKTKRTDELGVDHFHGHAVHSYFIAKDILERLRYDNLTKRKVLNLIIRHDRRLEVNNKSVKMFLKEIGGYEAFKDWASLRWADILSQNPKYIRDRAVKITEIERIAEHIIDNREIFSMSNLNIDGHDLIRIGYKGKEIGKELDRLLDVVIENNELNVNSVLVELSKINKDGK